MKAMALFIAVAAICAVAAIVTYVKDPERWSLALMWVGIAVVFAAIAIAQRRSRS